MKTLLAAAVSAVLLASGTVAFAETAPAAANAPKVEHKKIEDKATHKKAPAATNVSVEAKAAKVEEKGKVSGDHAKASPAMKKDGAKIDSAKVDSKTAAKSKIETPATK